MIWSSKSFSQVQKDMKARKSSGFFIPSGIIHMDILFYGIINII
jgi:hypothetical protein